MKRIPFVSPRPRATGAALIFALALVLVLAIAGVALIRFAGSDRISAAKLGREDRGLACAEAGIQYARRLFGACYTSSDNWNAYLRRDAGFLGFRWDRTLDGEVPTGAALSAYLATVPLQARGASNGVTLDPGSDLDGDGRPDFWVSIRDDADEVPAGLGVDDRTHDNNGLVVIRSECTNSSYAPVQGGEEMHRVIEATMTYGNQNMLAGAGPGNVVCGTGGGGGSAISGISQNAGSRGNNL